MLNLGGKKSFSIDHRVGDSFYLFVIDGPYTTNEGAKLSMFIEHAGIESYAIAVALQEEVWAKPIKGNITEWYMDHESKWKSTYLGADKPCKCKAIFAFGRALLQIIHGNHVTVDDFAVVFGHNYFYLNHDYLGQYDTFIFPLYPVEESLTSGYEHNYFLDMLKRRDDVELPNLTPINTKTLNAEQTKEVLEKNISSPFMSFDLETSGLNPVTDNIKCISYSFDGKDAYCTEWRDIDIDILIKCMRSKQKLITANGKFDILFLWNHDIPTDIVVTDDVILLMHCMNSGIKKGLKPQSYYWTPFGGYDDALQQYKDDTGVVDYAVIPFNICAPYAAMDAGVTFRAYFVLMRMVKKFDETYPSEKLAEYPQYCDPEISTLWNWYVKLGIPMLQVIAKAQFQGAYLDMREYDASLEGLKKLEAELKEKLKKEFNTPPDFKWTSGTEIMKLMKQNGLDLEDTSKDTLLNLIYDAVEPRLQDLIEYRHVFKALYSYVGTENYSMNVKNGAVKDRSAGWAKFKVYHKKDNTWRIHPNYETMGTETFRIISNSPNFQAIPAHGAYSKYIKKLLACPPSKMWYFETDEGEQHACGLDIVHLKNGQTKQPAEVVAGDDIDFIEKPYFDFKIC